jgi:hypothetical protein
MSEVDKLINDLLENSNHGCSMEQVSMESTPEGLLVKRIIDKLANLAMAELKEVLQFIEEGF